MLSKICHLHIRCEVNQDPMRVPVMKLPHCLAFLQFGTMGDAILYDLSSLDFKMVPWACLAAFREAMNYENHIYGHICSHG